MHLFTADKLPSRMGDMILFLLLPYDTREVPQLPLTLFESWYLLERLFLPHQRFHPSLAERRWALLGY